MSIALASRFAFACKVAVTLLSLQLLGSKLGVLAETHTIRFDNQCGFGAPRLIQKGDVLSTGEPYTHTGPFWAGIAYLQTGNCWLNGEGCTVVEMSLANPTCPGCGSSADLSLIPPLSFSVPTTFSYSGGCNGQGATCSSASCKTAFFVPDDNHVQVQCQENDVDLLITFCAPDPNAPKPIIHIPTTTLVAGGSPAAISTPIVDVSPNPNANSNSNSNSSSSPSSAQQPPVCAKGRASRRRRNKVGRSIKDAVEAGFVEVDPRGASGSVSVAGSGFEVDKETANVNENDKRAVGSFKRVKLAHQHVPGQGTWRRRRRV